MPVMIPAGVEVSIQGNHVRVKGPKGELQRAFPPAVLISQEDGSLVVNRRSDEKFDRAMHGTARALLNNMVVGVSQGFEKTLEVQGVGYRAEMKGKTLVLHMGYSHPVEMEPPAGIEFEVGERNVIIKVRGYDREEIGQQAALIRRVRPPEPYKGKGIRYLGEYVRRKAGKAGKA
jgi:large subunit ribosomal protein L6